MRTKTLLLAAALTAVGIATSMAQVYSVNAVGYVRTTLKPGFSLISNPLTATSNKISDLFKNTEGGIPDGLTVYKYNGAGYDIGAFAIFDVGTPAEVDNDLLLAPGEGAFVLNPTASDLKVTFVGEVPQGSLANPLKAGFSIISSQVPQAGTIDVLGYPAQENDTVYQWNATSKSYVISQFVSFAPDPAVWDPAPPAVTVGEAFFVKRSAAGSWTRTFSVNL